MLQRHQGLGHRKVREEAAVTPTLLAVTLRRILMAVMLRGVHPHILTLEQIQLSQALHARII